METAKERIKSLDRRVDEPNDCLELDNLKGLFLFLAFLN
jgi:hypothetical protein